MARVAREDSFSARQRRELQVLGVFDEQISELERNGLQNIREAMRTYASRTAERQALLELEGVASRFVVIMREMEESADSLAPSKGARRLAYERVQSAFHAAQSPNDYASFEDWLSCSVLQQLELLRLVRLAIAEVPLKERRHITTWPRPVETIDELLQRGFRLHYNAIGETAPEYSLRRSSSPTSPFRKIVEICFAAAGFSGSAENNIKNYKRAKKAAL